MEKREEFGKKYISFVLILWFGTEVIFNSTIEKIFEWKTVDVNEWMAVFILVLLVIQIAFFQKYQLNELVMIAFISFPIVIATLNSNHNKMISTWIFIVAVKHINFEKIVKITYYVELVATLFVFYLFASGVITEVTMHRGAILRHSLGFSHPNQLGIRVFLIIVSRCYIRRDKFNILDWILVIISAVFVNRVANSKTSFFALVILAIIMLVDIVMKKFGGDINKLSSWLISIAILVNVLSVFLSFIQVKKYPMLNRFDAFMSRRFSQCHRIIQYYGIKPFGQEIELIVNRAALGKYYRFWLDNAYMSIILRYGPIVFVCFSVLYIWTMIILKRMEQYALVEVLCLYAIYGIMENNFFSMSQNMFLLLLSYPIYMHNTKLRYGQGLLQRIKITW